MDKYRLVFFAYLLTLSQTLYAATYTVDRTDDSASATTCSDATANDCSLRGAIIKANFDATNDTIVLPAGTYTLSLRRDNGGINELSDGNQPTVGDLDVNNSLTIIGAGAGVTIIDASGITDHDRIMTVASVAVFSVSGITFAYGYINDYGGGIWLDTVNTSSIDECYFHNNRALEGGAIAIQGAGSTASISNSTFDSNTSTDGGGAIINFGPSSVSVAVINCTLSNNTAATFGGGGLCNSGTTTIINSTITGNTVTDATRGGGGLMNITTTPLTLKNTILTNNTVLGVSENCGDNGPTSDPAVSAGYNISDDASCAFTGTGDQNSVTSSILALELDDNGGTIPTYLLASGSPALDLIPAASCLDSSNLAQTEDQRGFVRPLTGTGTATSCDAGAVEVGCGNEATEAAEACDEGGVASATCDADCSAVACGDGTLNTAASEECDDGNTTAGDGCSATCTTETSSCGDSVIQSSESCDDGNTTAGDGCSATCATESDAASSSAASGCALQTTADKHHTNVIGFILATLGMVGISGVRRCCK